MGSGVSRREFLASAAAFSTLLSGGSVSRAYAANDTITIGVAGMGARGRDHARMFAYTEGCYVKTVCDPDANRVGRMPDQLARIQDKPVGGVQDMRALFDDPDIDAVCIASCDHWHGLGTIWACQAGKDVYVEKPASHNVWEGRKMIEATARYGRVVQVGTQNRIAPYIRAAREQIAAGKLGDVPLIKVYNMKPGGPFELPPDEEVPEDVDYDLYLGPAPQRPFNRAHFHRGWKKFWAYSGGDMADDGFHQIDIARLLMGDPPAPRAVHGMGGVVAFGDAREVPDTQVVSYDFGDCVMTFELTQFAPYMRKTSSEIRQSDTFPNWQMNATRVEVHGTEQMMYVGRHGGGWQIYADEERLTAQEYGRDATRMLRDNFLDCVRTRETPFSDIEQGHAGAVLVHLGNLATRLGGRRLEYDPATEQITNDEEASANELMRRDYRAPFTIPEEV